MVTRVLAGLAILVAAIGAAAVAAQERRLTRWLPTPAVILESGEETVRTRFGTGRHLRIRYRYRAGDDEHESRRIHPGPMSTTAGESASLRERFPVGAAATAYVDPSDPTRAFLVPERSFLPYLLVLLVAAPLGALAAGLATGGVRFVRSGEREHVAPREDGAGCSWCPRSAPTSPSATPRRRLWPCSRWSAGWRSSTTSAGKPGPEGRPCWPCSAGCGSSRGSSGPWSSARGSAAASARAGWRSARDTRWRVARCRWCSSNPSGPTSSSARST